jgi:hypothetical protein
MMSRFFLGLSLVVALALPGPAEASRFCQFSLWFKPKLPSTGLLERATFGPEFTFTNYDLLDEKPGSAYPLRAKTHKEVFEAYKKLCENRKDCHLEIGSDKKGGNFQVVYKDGWHFQVGIDEGVLEVQTLKGRYQDFVKNKKRLQSDLFDKMASMGLRPSVRCGGGHIHMGSDIFHEDPVLFRNFFADYANFPQLPFGALESDDPNHPPVAALKPHQQSGLVTALREFDTIANPLLKNFIWLIHSEVYTEAYTPSWGGGAYYQAIRLERMHWPNGMNTVELRGFRAQKSVDEFLLEIRLIIARLEYLRAKAERVPYRYGNEQADFSRQATVDAYYTYVEQTGLNWRQYRALLPGHLKYMTPYKQDPWSTKDELP